LYDALKHVKSRREAGKKMDINRMLDHLSSFSIFDHSVFALFLILGCSMAFTVCHTLQEWRGLGGPLWWNFGAIVGVRIPYWLGFLLFFVSLTAVLWLVAMVAITGSLLAYPVPSKCSAGALGALIGARIGDTLVSHVFLHARHYRPNPGLNSTPLYLLEAVFLLVTFSKGLTAGGDFSWKGVMVGGGFFCIILPMLWLSGILIPSWRKDRWHPGDALPKWVSIT
jgi:hypothetical protein